MVSLVAVTVAASTVLMAAGADRLRSAPLAETTPFLKNPGNAPVVVPDPGRARTGPARTGGGAASGHGSGGSDATGGSDGGATVTGRGRTAAPRWHGGRGADRRAEAAGWGGARTGRARGSDRVPESDRVGRSASAAADRPDVEPGPDGTVLVRFGELRLVLPRTAEPPVFGPVAPASRSIGSISFDRAVADPIGSLVFGPVTPVWAFGFGPASRDGSSGAHRQLGNRPTQVVLVPAGATRFADATMRQVGKSAVPVALTARSARASEPAAWTVRVPAGSEWLELGTFGPDGYRLVSPDPGRYRTLTAGAPDLVTPDRMAPDLVAPDRMAPDLVTPDRMAPDLVAPVPPYDPAGGFAGARSAVTPFAAAPPAGAGSRGDSTPGTARDRGGAGVDNPAGTPGRGEGATTRAVAGGDSAASRTGVGAGDRAGAGGAATTAGGADRAPTRFGTGLAPQRGSAPGAAAGVAAPGGTGTAGVGGAGNGAVGGAEVAPGARTAVPGGQADGAARGQAADVARGQAVHADPGGQAAGADPRGQAAHADPRGDRAARERPAGPTAATDDRRNVPGSVATSGRTGGAGRAVDGDRRAAVTGQRSAGGHAAGPGQQATGRHAAVPGQRAIGRRGRR